MFLGYWLSNGEDKIAATVSNIARVTVKCMRKVGGMNLLLVFLMNQTSER